MLKKLLKVSNSWRGLDLLGLALSQYEQGTPYKNQCAHMYTHRKYMYEVQSKRKNTVT